MDKEASQLKIRLPENLKNKIETHAKKNKRSINAEIIYCIESALELSSTTQSTTETNIKELVSFVTKRATRLADRELALEVLSEPERAFLDKISTLDPKKRSGILSALIKLLDTI